MKKITDIIHIEKRKNGYGAIFYRIHAILDNQDEGVAYADHPDEFRVNDLVEYFFDPKWDMAKFRHKGVDKL